MPKAVFFGERAGRASDSIERPRVAHATHSLQTMGCDSSAACACVGDSWSDQTIFAGVPGRGAEDAWYLTSLAFEEHRTQGRDISGGAADIFKCFDQVCRPLLYALLERTGCPSQLVDTYRAFVEHVQVYNNLVGSIGQPYARPCGIPQGCPLSMAFIAALMAPWCRFMKALSCIPRVLADDVLVYAVGDKHAHLFKRGFEGTFQDVEHLGGRIAVKKCFSFSTCARVRDRLRKHTWNTIHVGVQVVTNTRDLGAHLNIGMRCVGTTLTTRLKEATTYARTIELMRTTAHRKALLIRGKVLSLGLYGVEITPSADVQMTRWRAPSALQSPGAPRFVHSRFASKPHLVPSTSTLAYRPSSDAPQR